MKKLFAAVPVLGFLGICLASACSSGDQSGVSGTGKGGTGTGTGGSTQTGGSSAGTGGSATGEGGSTGTGGSATGEGGSTTGTGGSATGGSTGAGTGGSATGGSTGTGGTVVDASVGTGGRAGTGGGGNDAAPEAAPQDLMAVAAPLNGVMLVGPCVVEEVASVCHTTPLAQACPNNADPALDGILTTDKTVTLGGNPNQQYTITLHIQGEVECKQYNGATDQNAQLASPRADGWAMGGTPSAANAYNVYMIRVTNPGAPANTHTDYFLNSLQGPGVSNHTTYGIDYLTGTNPALALRAMGGASLRLIAADSNCDMIKNCGPTVNDGNICAGPIVIPNMEPDAVRLNPTFNFNTPFNGQWLVMTVKNVTSP